MDIVRLRSIVEDCIRGYHRRILILSDDSFNYLGEIIRVYTEIRGNKYTLLLSAKQDREDVDWIKWLLDGLKEYIERGRIKWGYVSFKALERIMGTTWDLLVADFRSDLRPNDLGRLIEVVRGGGLVILITPDLDEWPDRVLPFHKDMVVEPYTVNDLKKIFIRHLVNVLKSHPGIYVVRGDGSIHGIDYSSPEYKRVKPIIPGDSTFDMTVYAMALTQDQVDVIYSIDKASLRGSDVIVTADRGRGKSASLGLAMAGLLKRDGVDERLRIIVTAPEAINVREAFNFLAKALKRMRVKFNVKRSGESVVELNSELGKVVYLSPIDVFKYRCDYLVVDEASGIPVNLLEGYIEKYNPVFFSTTLHGYEGAGRGFQARFLPILKRMRRGRITEVNMVTPIRYGYGDPVEKVIFKALLLDSDPGDVSHLSREIDPSKLDYVKINIGEWLRNDLEKFKNYIGIYIFAHYRNRPNDIMILCDAPHHFARCLVYKDTVVNSLHLAFEGGISEDSVRRSLAGNPPSGHLIPTVLIRYSPLDRDFAYLKGIRVVRIATHPELMDRGIGSMALKHVIDEAKELGLDWVGSSFGATEELLNFWYKNGFIPVYLAPTKNPVSGEFSTIVIHPISREAREYVKRMRVEFKKLFARNIVDTYFVLDEKLAYLLLSMDKWSITHYPRITKSMAERLKEYVYGALHYGGAYDAIRELVECHFIRSPDKRVSIPRKYEYALISKVLQARSWEKIVSKYEFDKDDFIERVREYVGKMRLNYMREV